MMILKIVFGGFGRRFAEAIIAVLVLSVASAVVATSAMIIQGANSAMASTQLAERPDIIQIKSRFNRAIFETPRNGNLQPLTLPIYEPLIDPERLRDVWGGALVIHRQSLFRNVVSGDTFLNIYLYGIEPDKERKVSSFALVAGRFLHSDDRNTTVIDAASAAALGVGIGGSFPVRRADGTDLQLKVVGIIQSLNLRYPPPRTVKTPELSPDSPFASSGAFVTLQTSEEIFDRETMTDGLVVAPKPEDVPAIVDRLHQEFRLDPGIFVVETYSRFQRQVSDYVSTLALFGSIGLATAGLAGGFVAKLLDDAYRSRERQYAILLSVGWPAGQVLGLIVSFALAIVAAGATIGSVGIIWIVPAKFQMPSLHASLGSITPQIGTIVLTATAVVSVSVILLSAARMAWTLASEPIAFLLARGRS